MIYALGQCKCKLYVSQQEQDPSLVGTGKQEYFYVKIQFLMLRSESTLPPPLPPKQSKKKQLG